MAGLPPEEQIGAVAMPSAVTCPGCGVAVAVGYPKCPRCHATVPQPPRSRRVTFREEMITGGTSLEPPTAPPRVWPWLLVAALVIGGGALWLTTRGGDRSAAAADVATADDDPDDDPDDAVDDDGDDEAGAASAAGAAPGPATPADLGAALRALDGALRAERLWAKVSADDDVVVIESSLCDDAALGPVLADQAAGLRAAGATSVRCQQPHGAVDFERGL